MSYLLFTIYLVLFCWLLTKIKFISNSGLATQVIIILFLLRVAAGVLNGYVNFNYYLGTDIALFHKEGVVEYHLLFNDPKEYFTNIFQYKESNHGLFDITDSFWNNLRGNLIIKLFSLFNIFSFGNFYPNVIFYNFLIFFGCIALYRVFINLFPEKKTWLIIGVFLLPSVIYFSSGLHKDGLIFLGIGIVCYNLFFVLKEGFNVLKIIWFIVGLLIIFLLRNFVLITLLPALVAWVIAEKNRKFVFQTFIVIYLFFILLFFNMGRIHPSLDLPRYVSERQLAFIEISKLSNSAIYVSPLFPHFRSFLNNSPQALNHSLMRPYLTEKFTVPYIPAAVEIFIYQLLFFLFLLFRKSNNYPDPFVYFCIFFGLAIMLMIGYTIPIIGAITRYRSIYFPFVIIPILCYTNWGKMKSYFHIIK